MHAAFRAAFGRAPTTIAEAPGRINLIGEHTDYNDGWVLPTVAPQRTRVALGPRHDDTVRVASPAVDPGVGEFRLGAEHRGAGWLDYVQGVTAVLAREGHRVAGVDVAIESDVPVGAGLSSSAALEVALLRALREAFALALDDVAVARLAQRAEVEFVGARVGIMDQFAASLGRRGSAVLLDTRTLVHRRVPLPREAELVVIDSGVRHRHVAGGYNVRRAECEQASALLGVSTLRDVRLGDEGALPPPLDRRVRHVVSENARVLETVAALEAGRLDHAGLLFTASHRSQRDDFEVSVPEVDRLVAAAIRHPDVYGARLTGGGFGGAIVALVRAGRGPAVGAAVVAAAGGAPVRLVIP